MLFADVRYATTYELRCERARCNKALKGARIHPNGLARLTIEDIEKKLVAVRAELSKRRGTK